MFVSGKIKVIKKTDVLNLITSLPYCDLPPLIVVDAWARFKHGRIRYWWFEHDNHFLLVKNENVTVLEQGELVFPKVEHIEHLKKYYSDILPNNKPGRPRKKTLPPCVVPGET